MHNPNDSDLARQPLVLSSESRQNILSPVPHCDSLIMQKHRDLNARVRDSGKSVPSVCRCGGGASGRLGWLGQR